MSIKHHKPTSAGRRDMTAINYRGILTASEPKKSLVHGFRRAVGRNNLGRITTRHKGGGVARNFREIDFKYDKKNIVAKVETVEYDPNRSGFIGLVCYADGIRRYVLLSKSLKVGDTIIASETAEIKPGNRLPLGKMPVGTFVYNIEIRPNEGAKIARAAGIFAEVIAQDMGMTHIKMPSTEIRKIISTSWASVGEVSNAEYRLVNIGKAGRNRHRGIRPTVRGTAMNPVDHPHGGGEGRQGRGLRRAKSLWGKPTGKGQKTRTPKKYSNNFIVSRRKVGKNKTA
jgi:large subunit ribosomal protein L2